MGRWLALAVGSLIVAGLLALCLVVGRIPALSQHVGDPALFRRCLVVHVDLALIVWLLSFVVALSFLLPGGARSSWPGTAGVTMSAIGVGLMLAAALARGAEPILANYVPVIDHWLFRTGLLAFGLGIAIGLVDRRLLPLDGSGQPSAVPGAAVPGLRAAALALLLSGLTFASSWIALPTGLPPAAYYELIGWGGGHVMSLATSAAMLSVWLILVGSLVGAAPMQRRTASLCFLLLILPWAAAPLLPLRDAATFGRGAFTGLMRWGIFPAATLVLGCCLRALFRAFRDGRLPRERWLDPRLVGFVSSAGLCLVGYAIGAAIRGPSTVIPAHYHAAIGAVTASFMAVSYSLLERLGIDPGREPARRRLIALQPLIFAAGQAVFALGFALAGVHGTGRKLYAAEQRLRSADQELGLWIMGAGGVVAVCGGLLYLGLVITAWLRQEHVRPDRSALHLPEPEGING